jgi:hypothetical protein
MAADYKLRAILEWADRSKAGIKKSTESLGGLDKTAQDVKAAITGLGLVAAGKAAYELAELGAQSIRTRNAFEAISGGADEATARLDAMQAATRGALSEQEAMASANRLMQMGLADNATELGNVTEMAVRLGTAMGRDASQSIEEFALLLANQSIPRLDTFGISAGRVRTRINELRDANKDLTREQAFLQAVQEEGEKAMNRLGDAAEDEMLQFEKLEASVLDLKDAFGEALAQEMAADAGHIAEATDKLAELQVAYSEVREEQGTFEKGMRLLVPGLYMVVTGIDALTRSTDDAQPAIDGWMASWEAARDATEEMGEATEGAMHKAERWAHYGERMTAAAEAYTEGVEEAAEAAEEATPLFGGLADSVADLGRAFTEGIPDAEDMWSLILQTERAAGATAEELGAMAQSLGIASQEEVAAQLGMYALVDAWNQGERSMGNLSTASALLTQYHENLTLAEELEAEAAKEAELGHSRQAEALRGQAEAARDSAQAALDMALEISETGTVMEEVKENSDHLTGGLRGVESAARGVDAALRAIEREVNININYKVGERPGLQHGTSYFRGGMAIVGEGGPELVALPRGSQVFPTSAPETRAAMRVNNSFGGDTVIINDKMAAAMYLDQKRRQRVARMEARM